MKRKSENIETTPARRKRKPSRRAPDYRAVDRAADLIENWIGSFLAPGAEPLRSVRINLESFIFRAYLSTVSLTKNQIIQLLRKNFTDSVFETLRQACELIRGSGIGLRIYKSVLGGVCFDIIIQLNGCSDDLIRLMRRLESRLTSPDAIEFTFEAYRNQRIYSELIQPAFA